MLLKLKKNIEKGLTVKVSGGVKMVSNVKLV